MLSRISSPPVLHATTRPTRSSKGGTTKRKWTRPSRARSEVDSFVAELAKGDGEDFAVKAPIRDGDNVEHFWLSDVVYRDGEFQGTIGNDPGIVTNVTFGQSWTIKKAEISDWMFMRGGKMYGNYTMRPLLKTMPAEEAEQYRSMLAEP